MYDFRNSTTRFNFKTIWYCQTVICSLNISRIFYHDNLFLKHLNRINRNFTFLILNFNVTIKPNCEIYSVGCFVLLWSIKFNEISKYLHFMTFVFWNIIKCYIACNIKVHLIFKQLIFKYAHKKKLKPCNSFYNLWLFLKNKTPKRVKQCNLKWNKVIYFM